MCGCDIHLYIEYTDKQSLIEQENNEYHFGKPFKAYWRSFGGKISPGRNYWMFGILSKGVRSDFDEGFIPKGMPDFNDLSYSTRSDYVLNISDNENDESSVSLQKAIKWASGVYSSSVLYYREPTDDKPSWVSSPDWHSHSWLTTEEYEKAIQIYKNKCIEANKRDPDYASLDDIIIPEYEAILDVMKSLERNGRVCRVVFWFDN